MSVVHKGPSAHGRYWMPLHKDLGPVLKYYLFLSEEEPDQGKYNRRAEADLRSMLIFQRSTK